MMGLSYVEWAWLTVHIYLLSMVLSHKKDGYKGLAVISLGPFHIECV